MPLLQKVHTNHPYFTSGDMPLSTVSVLQNSEQTNWRGHGHIGSNYSHNFFTVSSLERVTKYIIILISINNIKGMHVFL